MATNLILRPNANGDVIQLHPYPTVPNWQTVDEVVLTSDSVRISEGEGVLFDLYQVFDHPSYVGGSINSIKVCAYVVGDDTGPSDWLLIKTHSTIYPSDKFEQSEVTPEYTWTLNPFTSSAWTWEEIDALQIGIKMQPPVCYPSVGCWRIYVVINYNATPVVTISTTTNIEEATATGNGNITDTGDSTVTKRGFCWNTTGNPTVADSKAEDTGTFGTGAFSKSITGLSPGTKYYIKAYAYNSYGYSYSDVLTFTTKPDPPTVLACSVISGTQIDLTWTKGSGAEKTMIRRKIDSAPTSPTDGDEAYFGTLEAYSDDELTRLTHYYYRAWSYKTDAPNSGYSDEYSEDDDTTPAELATVVTLDATDILQDQVTGNGDITDTGGVDVTTRGFKYALTKDDLNDVHDTGGTYGIGVYEKDITSLQGNTEYWYRTYAINSIGTAYGAWVKFQTAASGVVPTGTKINICSCYSGYTYQLNKSLTDDGQTYESYFVLSTDLAEKQGLHIKKRLEDLYSYFNNKNTGTCKIYVKRDNESSWQYAGEISLTGDEDIIVKHLPSENQDSSGDVDFLAKSFLIKFVFWNDFEFIGLINEFVPIGVR